MRKSEKRLHAHAARVAALIGVSRDFAQSFSLSRYPRAQHLVFFGLLIDVMPITQLLVTAVDLRGTYTTFLLHAARKSHIPV
jgi:hypothetical protein